MIDTTKLTDQQKWGLLYLMQNENSIITIQNNAVEERNKNVPRDVPLLEKKELWTLETFAEYKLLEIANNAYNQLVFHKEQMALQLFRSKTPEEQEAIVAQLQIPDVIKE